MPTALFLCTEADVLGRFGGQQFVNQILDQDGDGVYDPAILAMARGDASERVSAAAHIQIDVQAAAQAGNLPPELVSLAAQKSVYLCWVYGGQGQACPPHVQRMNDEVEQELERIRRKERTLGAPEKYPGSNQAVMRIDPDPDRNRLTVTAFSRGGGFL